MLIFSFLEDASHENLDLVDDLYYYSTQQGFRFFALTSSGTLQIEDWRISTGAEYDFLFADEVPLKTFIRSNPGLVLLNNGIIVEKWSHKDIPAESTFSDLIENPAIGNEDRNDLQYTALKVLTIFLLPFTDCFFF